MSPMRPEPRSHIAAGTGVGVADVAPTSPAWTANAEMVAFLVNSLCEPELKAKYIASLRVYPVLVQYSIEDKVVYTL